MHITPNYFISNLRLNTAKKILIETDLPVYDIAAQCGFENVPYFCFTFKKETGTSPLEFRKKYSYTAMFSH
jgi:transcriptional regulator GlxA family with amidase domain